MSAPPPSRLRIFVWTALHLLTIGIPVSFHFLFNVRWLDVVLPIFNSLVINFTPGWMFKGIIKDLDLAKDYEMAAKNAAKGLSDSEIEKAGEAAKKKYEAEEEIVAHLCITIISICGLLASVFIFNIAYMLSPDGPNAVPPPNTVSIASSNTTSLGAAAATMNASSPSAGRVVGVSLIYLTIGISLGCIIQMIKNPSKFTGKERYLRQGPDDYLRWVWPLCISCPMNRYRIVMTVLNSLLPVIRYCIT